MSPEEAVRRIARSAGAQASTSEKTAEAVGERVGDAYSDAGNVAQTQKRGQIDRKPLIAVLVGFALGFVAGLLIHGGGGRQERSADDKANAKAPSP
jgi:NAD+--asparagine ADP-ribosyltransferase